MKYEESIKKLEEIVDNMESGELDIDSINAQLKTAKKLIAECKNKLTKTEEEIKKTLEM